jgi:hypothetical protein
MAKKKDPKEIAVKKPKIGTEYVFMFAGGSLTGILDEVNEKLSQHYGEPWYWFSTVGNRDSMGNVRTMRYPVSIYNIVGVVKSEQ